MSLSDMFSKMFPSGNGNSNSAAGNKPSTLIPGLKSGKARQYAVLGVIGGALYLGLYLIFATSGDGKPKQQTVDQQKVVTTHVAAAGEAVDPRDRWIGTAGNKVSEHDARLTQQEQQTKDLMARFTAMQDEIRNKATNGNAPSPGTPLSGTPATYSQGTPLSGTPPSTVQTVPPLKPAPPVAPAQYPPGTPTSATQGATLPPPAVGGRVEYSEPVAEIGHVRIAAGKTPAAKGGVSPVAAATAAVAGSAKSETERMTGKNFLPVGFVRAKLLGGIYAPTGGQAQSNPIPVIMRLTDLAVLPNHFRANVRDCLVVGAGYGDLSAERAYVRLELLSCVRHDGQAMEIKVAGAVHDKNGMLGLQGNVISKQDKILTNALLAGVVGGIGQGVQNMSSNLTVTPFGNTVATPNSGQELRAGVGAGVGRALDRLANYQISLAEKVFPVIEVGGGREVDVAFTKGVELPIPLPALGGGDDD